jgi:hypothetical protein
VVEHEIILQRATIEDADKHARADIRSNRFIVGALCLLFNVVAGGLFWKLQPAALVLLAIHILSTLVGSMEPADALPDGEIGSNAAAIALGARAGPDLLVLPGFSFVVCAVFCLSEATLLDKTVVLLAHAASTISFQLRMPSLVGPALFGLSLIKTFLEPR